MLDLLWTSDEVDSRFFRSRAILALVGASLTRLEAAATFRSRAILALYGTQVCVAFWILEVMVKALLSRSFKDGSLNDLGVG
jgi:hypothetical protein